MPFFRKRKVSPFAGEPRTTRYLSRDVGPIFRIEPTYLTPESAKTGDGLGTLTAWAIGGTLAVASGNAGENALWFMIGSVVLGMGLHKSLQRTWRKQLRRRTTIEIDSREIRIRSVWFGWTRYDRTYPHRFELLEHDETLNEQLQEGVVQRQNARKGIIKLPDRYYQDSNHVILNHAGQRRDFFAVHDKKEARQIHDRLALCVDHLTAKTPPSNDDQIVDSTGKETPRAGTLC